MTSNLVSKLRDLHSFWHETEELKQAADWIDRASALLPLIPREVGTELAKEVSALLSQQLPQPKPVETSRTQPAAAFVEPRGVGFAAIACFHKQEDAMDFLANAARIRQPEPMVCYSPCDKHRGLSFTMTIGYAPPIKTVCPICEPPRSPEEPSAPHAHQWVDGTDPEQQACAGCDSTRMAPK
jgi:hypothetical protein